MNTFGERLRLTTWGESHGPAIGGVIDGYPSNVKIDFEAVQMAMAERRPGREGVSRRNEEDMPEFLSGISDDGYSFGTPISFLIRNKDVRPEDYGQLKDKFRPNHADYTYMRRYGIREWRGGGRASARETACRVVAGALAMQLLEGIRIKAFLTDAGKAGEKDLLERLSLNPRLAREYEPDEEVKRAIASEIESAREAKDSVGGTVTCIILMPSGIGNPVYGKLNAKLAEAMMGINAAKGFEIGLGAALAHRRGSEVMDEFFTDIPGEMYTRTNYSGGIQGGISNGMPIFFNVHFKPTPTIGQPMPLMDYDSIPVKEVIKGRHDPCVAVRAVPVVKAMAALVVANQMPRLPLKGLHQNLSF